MLMDDYRMDVDSAKKLMHDGGSAMAMALLFLLKRKDEGNAGSVYKI